MALIKCEDLSLGYGGTPIAEHLSFEVNSGDFLCIIGENGSGKSTLMKTLLHLQEPMSGSITLGEGLKKNEIGYLPQQTAAQKDFPASVWEIVMSGFQGKCGLRPFYNQEEKEYARLQMARMELTGMEKKCFREMSGGQQQRVLLARALCAADKVLLLDEPVAGLDPMVTAELYNMLEMLNRQDGMTIIMVTHDMTEGLKLATHILHMGEEDFFGLRNDYFKTPHGRRYHVHEHEHIRPTYGDLSGRGEEV